MGALLETLGNARTRTRMQVCQVYMRTFICGVNRPCSSVCGNNAFAERMRVMGECSIRARVCGAYGGSVRACARTQKTDLLVYGVSKLT